MKKTQVVQQNKAHYKKGMVLKLVGLPPKGEEPEPAAPAEVEAGAASANKEKSEKQKQLHEDQIGEVKAFFEPFAKAAFVLIQGNEV
jgi:hypothetical protein